MIEVWADVACPFTHVGLRHLVDRRAADGSPARLGVRAWPLEWVNGAPLAADVVGEEIAALRSTVAPHLFRGFDPATFPSTSIPALALTAHATRTDPAVGEAVALSVRHALFERGLDPSDEDVLEGIAREHGLERPAAGDETAVREEYEQGRARGVLGSPYFVVEGHGYFCPALDIAHDDGSFRVRFDHDAFEEFAARALASP